MRTFLLACFLLPFTLAIAAEAQTECSVKSGPTRVALLELYTSEGCSSCPPADRWLSGLASQGIGSERVVPLALHVDYWDYIGWQDRFAKPAFTARQGKLALLGNSTLVYTPQIMLNGRDYRNWKSTKGFEHELKTINSSHPKASIELSLKPGSNLLDIAATAETTQPGNHALYIALYENDLKTAVNRGENAGTALHHDFVVREWLGPFPINRKAVTPLHMQVKIDNTWKTKQLGVAAFVQSVATGEVLQAVSLPYCM